VPAKPRWYRDLEAICTAVASFPNPVLERADLEQLLRVGRRRAQQILENCATGKVGASSITTPEALIRYLRQLADGEAAQYEVRRRRKLARTLAQLHREWTAQPRVLVEAPLTVMSVDLEGLPEGVELGPGRVTVQFRNAQEGVEKLLALAMAIGNDVDGFERRTAL
jgi:hypothetical protein